MLFVAVGLVVSSIFTTPGIVMTGPRRSNSSNLAAVSDDPFAVRTRSRSRDEHLEVARGGGGLLRDLGHTVKKEPAPRLPVPGSPHLIEQTVVVRPATLEVQAEVKERGTEELPVLEQLRDQQSSHASVCDPGNEWIRTARAPVPRG